MLLFIFTNIFIVIQADLIVVTSTMRNRQRKRLRSRKTSTRINPHWKNTFFSSSVITTIKRLRTRREKTKYELMNGLLSFTNNSGMTHSNFNSSINLSIFSSIRAECSNTLIRTGSIQRRNRKETSLSKQTFLKRNFYNKYISIKLKSLSDFISLSSNKIANSFMNTQKIWTSRGSKQRKILRISNLKSSISTLLLKK